MAIYIFTGRPRHGKTMAMVRTGVQLLKNGERIFSNLKLNLGVGSLKKFSDDIVGDFSLKQDRDNEKKQLFYWSNIHEWEHFEKGNIFVDEAQRYFNARQWDQLSSDTEIKLQQHGKEDLNIFGTTQHYSRIDVSLRQLVEGYYDVETIFGNPDNLKPFLGFKLFRVTFIPGIEYMVHYENMKINPELKLNLPIKSKIYFYHRRFGLVYDTRAKVGQSESMPLVHKVRSCAVCGKQLVTHL